MSTGASRDAGDFAEDEFVGDQIADHGNRDFWEGVDDVAKSFGVLVVFHASGILS
jgi:hypothetical protein